MLRSKLQWFIAVAGCILITTYFHQGKKMDGVIWSDQEGYYIYLPALFIHGFGDIECVNGCSTIDTPNGPRLFTKYTYGIALLESPFFLGAHAVAKLTDFEANGRSRPYIWGIMLAAIFYMLAGLYFISKLLAELNYSALNQWTVPLGLLLGTNLFYYTFRESGMSHVYSFFLVSLLLYGSHQTLVSEDVRWKVLTSSVLALIILIRPTNAILGLVPIFWNTQAKEVFKRVRVFMTDYRWWLLFGAALVVFFTPQVMYWRAITGDFIFYSYREEGFSNWMAPKMLHVLFSHTNGWLIYSPIALTGLFGLLLMIYRKQVGWFMPLLVLTMATYVFGSWWAWWFGGAYGHRCYVEYLPLLAVPSAAAISWIIQKPNLLKIGFASLAVLAIYVNIRMSDIYHGMWDGPDWNWGSYLGKLKAVFYMH